MADNVVFSGVSLGTVIAVVVSWTTNHSILWCLFHGFFGWFYLIYYVLSGQCN